MKKCQLCSVCKRKFGNLCIQNFNNNNNDDHNNNNNNGKNNNNNNNNSNHKRLSACDLSFYLKEEQLKQQSITTYNDVKGLKKKSAKDS